MIPINGDLVGFYGVFNNQYIRFLGFRVAQYPGE